MKRKLNKKEQELTEKGTARLTEEVIELKENLDYNLALIEKQKYLREFDDKWREILRNRKNLEDKKLINQLKILIKEKEFSINEMKKQLKEGVEEKTPEGVG